MNLNIKAHSDHDMYYVLWKTIQALSFFTTSLILFLIMLLMPRIFRTKSAYIIPGILSFLFLIFAGEESDWGNLWLDFNTPHFFKKMNSEARFNFHDLVIYDINVNRYVKVLFKLFVFFYVVVLPILNKSSKEIDAKCRAFCIPIPPLAFIPFALLAFLFGIKHYEGLSLVLYPIPGWLNREDVIETLFGLIALGTIISSFLTWKHVK
jgi:hypothetical protein